MEKELEMPCVHLNGTSREELIEQHLGVIDSLTVLMESLAIASPNGRDYYPKGDTSFSIARRQHAARIDAVRWMLKEEAEIVLYLNK